MAAKKKPAAKVATKKGSTAKRKPSSRRANGATAKARSSRAKGKTSQRLTAAQQATRDTLIVTRVAQGWPWAKIAKEAGVTVRTAQRAHAAKKAAMPDLMSMDPLAIVRILVEGFQMSIGDFEAMALDYAEKHPSAAVGAKKAANDARGDLAAILQATGSLPHELGTLRHVVELQAVAKQIIELVVNFEGAVKSMELPKAKREAVLGEASKIADGLESIAGTARET
jgi:hypothetical protein